MLCRKSLQLYTGTHKKLPNCLRLAVRAMSSGTSYQFDSLKVTSPHQYVYQVEINRPQKRNAMNKAFWREMVTCFNQLAVDSDCRAVVLSGAGKTFTAGIDIMDHADMLMSPSGPEQDTSRRSVQLYQFVQSYQETFNVIEKCPKPVIAAIHGACVGGGVDMVTACDIRYASQDAWFQVKEVDLAITADVGTLQRLPKVLGSDSLARELCYTARKMYADEAKQSGLVSRILADRETVIAAALDTASDIAERSPVAVQGTKISLVYSRDHTVADGLNQVKLWNAAMLQSEDIIKAAQGQMEKKTPTFSKL